MTRRILGPLLLLAALLPVVSLAQTSSASPTSWPGIGQIVWVDTQGATHRGSFNVLTDTDLLTCAHVVEGVEVVSCSIQGRLFAARVTKRDEVSDLAHLTPKEPVKLQQVKIAVDYQFQKGGLLTCVGYTRAENPISVISTKVIEREIRRPRKVEGDDYTVPVVILAPAVNPGMSGGGVFNSKGELVGVISAKFTKVSASVIIPYVARLPQKQ